MSCATCVNWKNGPMNVHGFGACAHGPIYEFLPSRHTCTKEKPLEGRELARRTLWLKKKGVS